MPIESCLKCGVANARDKYACQVCGARLPWADSTKLRAKPPLPRAEMKEIRPSRWPYIALCAALCFVSAALALGGARPLSPSTWHLPNTKPRSVQEDEIRVAVFKKMLPTSGSEHRDQLLFLSLGGSQGADPSESVMQQLAACYPLLKRVSAASVAQPPSYNAKDKETEQKGAVLFVSLKKFSQDKAQVSAGYWAGMMMSCWSTYDVEWDGLQWTVGRAQAQACS